MRKIRYQVACSLDGYIAGPSDEYDWIVMDPEIDFAALFEQFDTALMGRRSYEVAGAGAAPGMKTVVASRTLRPEEHRGVQIVGEKLKETIDELRSAPGKDIWLFGGGVLFASLLELGCVDFVEPAVVPVVLGGGRPFLPAPAVRRRLSLVQHRVYRKSGIVFLSYAVVPEDGGANGKRKATKKR